MVFGEAFLGAHGVVLPNEPDTIRVLHKFLHVGLNFSPQKRFYCILLHFVASVEV